MSFFSRARSLWNALVHQERLDRELDDELRSAVEILAARLEGEGLDRSDVLRQAERQLAGPSGLIPVRAAVREARTGAALDALIVEARHASRSLRHAPLFTGAIVATLALGIGANTAIFSVVHAMLLAPLPYPDSDRLAVVWLDRTSAAPGVGYPRGPMSGPDFRNLREGTSSFEALAGIWASGTLAFTGEGGPEQLRGAYVTTNFFDVLGVAPAFGRGFTASDIEPGAPRSLVIGWDFFQRRFGGDVAVVGRRVEVDGHFATVAGVLPRDFRLLLPPEASVPDHLQVFTPFWPDMEGGPRRNLLLRVIGRLRPGVTIAAARADVDAMAAGLSEELGQPRTFATASLQADDVREIRDPLLALFAGVAILMAIACVNVASLLAARAAARARETALRLALGASRIRLLGQSVVEGLQLTMLGVGAGVIVGYWSLRLVLAMLPPSLSRLEMARIDGTVIAFTVGVAAVSGLLLSLAPLGEIVRAEAARLLPGRWQSGGAQVRYPMRAGLVVLEVALSLVLVVSAGLLVRGFVEVLRIDPGFRAEGRLTFRTMLARETMLQELEERLATVPGVTGVGAISHVPYDDQPNWAVPFSPELPMPPNAPLADSRVVSPSLFAALEVPLIAGRRFTNDDRHLEQPVVIVDETLARALWPGQGAVGQTLRLEQGERAHTVVGVVRHMRHRSLVDDLLPQVFRPWALAPRNPMAFVISTTGEPAAMVPSVRAVVSELDPRAAIFEVRPLTEYVEAARGMRRFTTILAAAFAGVALLLAGVGVYAVLAYAVAGRRHELGVRRALGASHARVVGAVFGEGFGFALTGSVVGLAGALVAGQLLQAQIYIVDARDPISYAVAVALILLGAAVACGIPAYRAATVDPIEALRTE